MGEMKKKGLVPGLGRTKKGPNRLRMMSSLETKYFSINVLARHKYLVASLDDKVAFQMISADAFIQVHMASGFLSYCNIQPDLLNDHIQLAFNLIYVFYYVRTHVIQLQYY